MNPQRGGSSLLLTLLLLVVSSLMLQGTHRQYQRLVTQVTFERRALAESAEADSLLQWGKWQTWQTTPGEQCLRHGDIPGRLCLRLFTGGDVLLIARSGSQWRWQSGTVSADGVRFHSRGWSDFCPRKEAGECQLP